MNLKYFISLLILITSLITLMSCSEDTAVGGDAEKPTEYITIGFIGEKTFEPWIEKMAGMFNSADLAVAEINAEGGINGKMLRLQFEDAFANKGEAAITNADKLNASGVKVIIGSGWSSNTMALAEKVAIPNDMLVMSYSASSPAISSMNDNDLVWRTCASDAFQSAVTAKYIFENLGKSKVAIIHRDDTYGNGLTTVFKENFKGTSVTAVKYPADVKDFATYDFSAQVKEAFTSNPDVIFLGCFDADRVKLLNDIAKNSDFKTKKPIIFTSEGLKLDIVKANVDASVLASLRGVTAFKDPSDPNNTAFMNNFEARYGAGTGKAAVTTCYDAVYLIAYAIQKNNGDVSSGAALAQHLRSISGEGGTVVNAKQFTKGAELIKGGQEINYDGPSGGINFDKNGDIGSGVYRIMSIKNGAEHTEAEINFP